MKRRSVARFLGHSGGRSASESGRSYGDHEGRPIGIGMAASREPDGGVLRPPQL